LDGGLQALVFHQLIYLRAHTYRPRTYKSAPVFLPQTIPIAQPKGTDNCLRLTVWRFLKIAMHHAAMMIA
jgi:hypothetical protein